MGGLLVLLAQLLLVYHYPHEAKLGPVNKAQKLLIKAPPAVRVTEPPERPASMDDVSPVQHNWLIGTVRNVTLLKALKYLVEGPVVPTAEHTAQQAEIPVAGLLKSAENMVA